MIYRNQLIVDQQEEILLDKRRSSYVIRRSDWNRLKAAISTIPHKTNIFENAGWAALGIAASFVIAAITLPSSAQTLAAWVLPTCWIGGVASAVVGVLALLMQGAHGKLQETSKESCLSLMSDLESGFDPSTTERIHASPLTVLDLEDRKGPPVKLLRGSITDDATKIEGDTTPPLEAANTPKLLEPLSEGSRVNQLTDVLARNVSQSIVGRTSNRKE